MKPLRLPKGAASFVVLVGLFAFKMSREIELSAIDNSKGECSMQEIEHDNPVEKRFYGWLMRHRFGDEAATHVALITVSQPQENYDLLHDPCKARRFLADLVPALEQLGAAEVVIDKTFSSDLCTGESDAAGNKAFVEALHESRIPVIVGRATDATGLHQAESCLALHPSLFAEPPVDAGTSKDEGIFKLAKPPQVTIGLLRLNENTMQIPLKWLVTNSVDNPYPGLAYQAASAFDPEGITKALKGQDLKQHPYAMYFDAPKRSALNVLCYDPNYRRDVDTFNWGKCDAPPRANRIGSRVAVIGNITLEDQEAFPGGDHYGPELQASYIEALVSQRFTRELCHWVDWGLVWSFVILLGVVDLLTDEKISVYGRSIEKPLALAGFSVLCAAVIAILCYALLVTRSVFAPVLLLSLWQFLLAIGLSLVVWGVDRAKNGSRA